MKKIYLLIITAALLLFVGCNMKKSNITDPVDTGGGVDLSKTILNSSFEQSTPDGLMPLYWLTRIAGHPAFNYFTLDKSTFKSGSQSLKINFDQSASNPDPVNGAWGGISQTIFINDLIPGQRYYLNFWFKSQTGNFQIRIAKNGELEFGKPLLSYIVSTPTDWTKQKIAFTIDSETNYLELWINTKTALAKDGLVTGWIDDVTITSK